MSDGLQPGLGRAENGGGPGSWFFLLRRMAMTHRTAFFLAFVLAVGLVCAAVLLLTPANAPQPAPDVSEKPKESLESALAELAVEVARRDTQVQADADKPVVVLIESSESTGQAGTPGLADASGIAGSSGPVHSTEPAASSKPAEPTDLAAVPGSLESPDTVESAEAVQPAEAATTPSPVFVTPVPATTPSSAPAPARKRKALPPPALWMSASARTPFAGMPLSRVSEILAERFRGRTPTRWGEHLPGVVSRLFPKGHLPEAGEGAVIALTFDACGGKKGEQVDEGILDYLRENSIPATLFVSSKWALDNADLLRRLAAEPLFEIAGHGATHRPCSLSGRKAFGIRGTSSFTELVGEVEGNMRAIAAVTGRTPRWFRSGTAYYDDIAVAAIHDMGYSIAGFSITADAGATLRAPKVTQRTLQATHGDILLFHMNKPRSGTREGLLAALPKLMEMGVVFVRLSDVLPPLENP